MRRNLSKSVLVKSGDDASDLAFFFWRGVLLDAIALSSLVPNEKYYGAHSIG